MAGKLPQGNNFFLYLSHIYKQILNLVIIAVVFVARSAAHAKNIHEFVGLNEISLKLTNITESLNNKRKTYAHTHAHSSIRPVVDIA